MRLSVGGAPSDIGQSLMPYLTVETSQAESQCEILTILQMAEKDDKIKNLKEQLEDNNKQIDELEKKFEQANHKAKDSEQVKKLKYDNKILLSQLSQYKKAEKFGKEIANDYESMKMKYFNVLTENEKQKTQLQEFYTNQCNKDTEIRDLLKERERNIDELYGLRMDINKKINMIEEKDGKVEALTKRLQSANEQAQMLLAREREVTQLKAEIMNFMQMLQQV